MARPFRSAAEIEQERREQALFTMQVQQLQGDVRSVLETSAGRRLVWTFIQAMGVDETPFNTNAMAQSRLIGRAEAAQWWLRAIRENCAEREAQMRAEANTATKRLLSQSHHSEEEGDDD